MKSFSFSTDHTDHLKFFRKHASRKAAGKASAALEGVGLNAPTIKACFTAHPSNHEEIVQDRLTGWCGGSAGTHPPTWDVLINAMKYAEIDQHIEDLKTSLNQPAVTEGMLCLPCGVLLIVTVTS